MKIYSLYTKLLTQYGPQGWWPAKTKYEVVVGAVLTQNTNWRNVEKALDNLRKEKALNAKKILEMDLRKLKKLVRPSGFYNQKAKRLKDVTKKYLKLKNEMSVEELREELLSVKGVGKETADSIVLYAFEKPIFVIDAYTRRFCERFDLFKGKEYDDYREFFESNLPGDVELYKEYHALIVEWAKRN